MHAGRRFTFREVIYWTRRDILIYLIVAVVVRLPYTKLGVRRQAEFVARGEAYR